MTGSAAALIESRPVSATDGAPVFQFTLLAPPPEDRIEKKKDPAYILQKLEEWREATLLHNPGEADRPAMEIGSWHQEDLEIVVDFLSKLASQSVKSIKQTVARAPVRSRLRLTAREVQQGDLNRVLKQGALLHTDIALFDLETGEYLPFGDVVGKFADGRVRAEPKKIHWKYARCLIDRVSPSPSQDAMARQWYVATTAYMQGHRLLAYAVENIDGALKLFPSDDRILFYAGVLHEIWASPANQDSLLPLGGSVAYGSKKSELKKAREFYRKTIKANPDFAEAHMRLGRVLLLLGDIREACAELRKAAPMIEDSQISYYNSLHLGRALESLALLDEARQQYENAAKLYPAAQSPLLALSLLARNNDDVEGAIAAVHRVFELPPGNTREEDPLWTYDQAHVRDAEQRVQEMQKTFGELPR
jgi:tetratricopeptide (TPR) repeat protein